MLMSKQEHDNIVDVLCRLRHEQDRNVNLPKKEYEINQVTVYAEDKKGHMISYRFRVEYY